MTFTTVTNCYNSYSFEVHSDKASHFIKNFLKSWVHDYDYMYKITHNFLTDVFEISAPKSIWDEFLRDNLEYLINEYDY